MWDGGVKNIQIELQINNNCCVFNKNIKHNMLNKLKKNKLLSYYPWPNTYTNTNRNINNKIEARASRLQGNVPLIYFFFLTDMCVFVFVQPEA